MALFTVAPNVARQLLDDDGNPLSGGFLYIYEAGTLVLATVYRTDAGTPWTQPIELDGSGRLDGSSELFLTPGVSYDFEVRDADGVTIWTKPGIGGTPLPSPSDVPGTAGETIGPNQSVYLSQGDGGRVAGRWYLTDATLSYASSLAVETGWVVDQILIGQTGIIQQIGIVSTASPVVAGLVYYAASTPGTLTSTAPVNRRIIGVANSISTLVLGVAQPWTATAVALAEAATPAGASGGAGALIRRTDSAFRGLMMNSGTQWIPVNGGWANVREFGATGDGVTDDSAAIQAAIDSSNPIVFFPAGDYNLAGTALTLGNGQTLLGVGIGSNLTFRSRLLFTGNGSALIDTHPVNGSGRAEITVCDLYIVGSGGASTGAAIELNAGGFAFYTFSGVRIGGTFKYGIIADATIDLTITECIFENGLGVNDSCHIWIVNGDSRRTNQALGFSNVISITNNQLNGAEFGTIDDGGDGILIEGNNFNGHSISLQMAGRTDFIVQQNDFENAGVITGNANILFQDRSGVGGGALNVDKGPCSAGVVAANGLFQDMVSASSTLVKWTATTVGAYHRGLTVESNKCGNQLGRSAAFDVTRLGQSYVGQNSDNVTAGPAFTGIHYDAEANTLLLPGGTTDSLTGAFAVLFPALTGTKVWTPTAALADGAVSSTTITVTGAAVGDTVRATHSAIGANDVMISAHVQAADTVRVCLENKTGGPISIPEGTSRVYVDKVTL